MLTAAAAEAGLTLNNVDVGNMLARPFAVTVADLPTLPQQALDDFTPATGLDIRVTRTCAVARQLTSRRRVGDDDAELVCLAFNLLADGRWDEVSRSDALRHTPTTLPLVTVALDDENER